MFIIISGFKLYSRWVLLEDAFVVFLHFLLKFKPFDEFFFRPKRDGKSLSVCSY